MDDHVEMKELPWARRVLRVFAGGFAVTVVILAMLVSMFRLVVPAVPQYRAEIESWASGLLGAPVSIAGLDLRWFGLRPEVVLRGVNHASVDGGMSFAVRELRIGLSYRALFRARRLAPARIVLIAPDVKWVILEGSADDRASAAWVEALEREDRRGSLVIDDGRLTLRTVDGYDQAFEGIEGKASSDGRAHRLELRARIAGLVGRTVRLEGSARGSPGHDDWRAEFRIDAQHIDLAGLQARLEHPFLDGGRLDLALQAEVVARSVTRASLDVGLAGLVWGDAAEGTLKRVDRAAFEMHWTGREGEWEARLDNFVVHRHNGVSDSGPVTVDFTGESALSGNGTWRVRGQRTVLQDFTLLGAVVPDGRLRVLDLLAVDLHGTLSGFDLRVMQAPDTPVAWSLQASGERFSWQPSEAMGLPGIRGLDVMIDGNERGGRLDISGDVAAAVPWLFRDGLPTFDLQGDVTWRVEEEELVVFLPGLNLGNQDVETIHARGEFRWPGRIEDARVELFAEFVGIDMTRGSPYLPVMVMPPGLVTWLGRSVRGGVATSGRLEWRGPVQGFPYREGQGVFNISFDTVGLNMDYAARWPLLVDADARVVFLNDGFRADVTEAWIAGARVGSGIVGIERYGDGILSIEGDIQDTVPVLLNAFLATPTGTEAGDWLRLSETGGAGRLQLDITLPLRDHPSTRVTGTLTLKDALFSPGGTTHALTAVNGVLKVDGTSVIGERINARLLDRPVRIGVKDIMQAGAHVTRVSFAGTFDRAFLAHAGIGIGPGVMSGSASWLGDLDIHRTTESPPILNMTSDMRGMTLDLPAPLGKSAEDVWVMMVSTTLDEGGRDIRVQAPTRLQALIRQQLVAQEWVLRAATVQLGPGELQASLLESGVVLTGWLGAWRLGHGGIATGAYEEMPLRSVDLEIADLEAFGQSLGRAKVRGLRNAAGWHMGFEGERISGTLDLPDLATESAPIRLDLGILHLEKALLGEGGGEALDPRTMPAIAFHVRDFTSGRVSLGEINGMLRPLRDGIALDGFIASAMTQRIELKGSWLTDGRHHSTTLHGTVESTDVQRTLAALGFIATMDASAGYLDGEVSWPDLPYGEVLSELDGQVQVRIERGSLSEVTPGAGRMFGLLSLNALPRRLALDFSDVFRRGLAFDSIHGNFRIERGQAYTDDLVLSSPAVQIAVSGRTGLAARDYDQSAVVTASLASSLTLAGVLAGGPGVGAALLIASELLKAPLQDMSRAHYRITGAWEQPSVERIPDPQPR